MEECEMLTAGLAHEADQYGVKLTSCPIKECPYGKLIRMGYQDQIPICTSDGIVERRGLISTQLKEKTALEASVISFERAI